MTHRKPAPGTTRRTPAILVAGSLVIGVAINAALGDAMLSSASSPVPSSPSVSLLALPRLPSPSAATSPIDDGSADRPGGDQEPRDGELVPRGQHRGALGEADGVLPDGTTALDAELPGVTELDPALLLALRKAARHAAKDGIELLVTSGWRSRNYQERLLRQAVSEYGSAAKAARWVATADTSPHVSGDAVDIGPVDAMAWLSKHGARFGLCQIYRNEPWHYEMRPKAVDHRCPRMYANPTLDPRMRQ